MPQGDSHAFQPEGKPHDGPLPVLQLRSVPHSLLSLQASAYDEESSYPFDVLGAQTEGMIGYLIEQELGNMVPFDKPIATILTMTEVDPDDPAMKDPTKFVGPVYTEAESQRMAGAIGKPMRIDRLY